MSLEIKYMPDSELDNDNLTAHREYHYPYKKDERPDFYGENIDLNNPKIDEETKRILGLLKDCTVFKIAEREALEFIHTDCDLNEYIHLPYPITFLDVNLKFNDRHVIRGILLYDDEENEDIISFLVIYDYKYEETVESLQAIPEEEYEELIPGISKQKVIEVFKEEKEIDSHCPSPFTNGTFVQGSIYSWKEEIEGENEEELLLGTPEARKMIGMFVQSFLNFLNNKDVTYVKRELNEKSVIRKLKRGRDVHIPGSKENYYLKITGETRKYLDEYPAEAYNKEYLKKNKAHIVRGYYKTYTHLRYKTCKGKTKWCHSYVTGIGEYIKKKYLVTRDKIIYYNQTLLEETIRELFNNYIVLSNTRGFLDGLEIDCYVQTLKLGFEYNGEQHYLYPNAFHKNKEEFKGQQRRDKKKLKLAEERGILLIIFKYDEPLSKEYIKKKVWKILDEKGYIDHTQD
jgi:hypothetical protein